MKILLRPILAIFTFFAMTATGYGDVIYSNLGPGNGFSSTNGWSIGYPFNANEVGQSMAFSFMPTNDYVLTSVDIAISNDLYAFGGSSDFVIGIYTDTLNMPGSLLTSSSGTAPASSGPPASITTVLFSGSTLLSGNTLYWIGLHPASAQPTSLGWWWNYQESGLQSLAWQSNVPSHVLLSGGWDTSYNHIESAYQVNGTLATVPEPSTFLLLGSGMAGLGLMWFRKRSKT